MEVSVSLGVRIFCFTSMAFSIRRRMLQMNSHLATPKQMPKSRLMKLGITSLMAFSTSTPVKWTPMRTAKKVMTNAM